MLVKWHLTHYAVLVGGSNGDGAWRGLVTIVELIDPRPYIFQTPVYGSLTYTVIYMSDRLLTPANPNPHLTPPPDLRSKTRGFKMITVTWRAQSVSPYLTRTPASRAPFCAPP